MIFILVWHFARKCWYGFKLTKEVPVYHNGTYRLTSSPDDDVNSVCIWDFLLVLDSNLGLIMSHFRDIRLFVRQKLLFKTFSIPTPILPYTGPNFRRSIWNSVDPRCWGLQRAKTQAN